MIVNEKTPLFTELIVEESATVSGGGSPIAVVQSQKLFTINDVNGYGKRVTLSISDIVKHDALDSNDGSQLYLPTSAVPSLSL